MVKMNGPNNYSVSNMLKTLVNLEDLKLNLKNSQFMSQPFYYLASVFKQLSKLKSLTLFLS